MIMKRLGLISALGLSLIAAPGAALAQGWHGSPGGVYRGAPMAPAPRPVPAPGYYRPVPGGHDRTYYTPAHTRVWIPGYWGFYGGTRAWMGGAWTYPPFQGWLWVQPHWQWNGYQYVWVEGYWAPPSY